MERVKIVVVGFFPIFVVLGFAPLMFPVRQGTSAGFWRHACGVELGRTKERPAVGFYLPRDGWFIYYDQGFHGEFLFRVPQAEAIADFPHVIAKLEEPDSSRFEMRFEVRGGR